MTTDTAGNSQPVGSTSFIEELAYYRATVFHPRGRRSEWRNGGQTHRMVRAVEKLRRDFDKPLRIEDVAMRDVERLRELATA